MIRVFLLDDHEVVRRGVAELLAADGDIAVVGESGSAAEATRTVDVVTGKNELAGDVAKASAAWWGVAGRPLYFGWAGSAGWLAEQVRAHAANYLDRGRTSPRHGNTGGSTIYVGTLGQRTVSMIESSSACQVCSMPGPHTT